MHSCASFDACAWPVTRRRVEFVCDLYIPEVHAGVLDYARSAGWSVLDSTCYEPSLLFTDDEPCDGTLAIAAMPQLDAWLKKQTSPVVRLISNSRAPETPAVMPDYKAIGIMAAEHLLSLGMPQLAFCRFSGIPETEKMWEGFSGTLAAAGRTAHLIDYPAGLGRSKKKGGTLPPRWRWLSEQLAALPRPLAILVEDDRFASEVMEAAAVHGLRIPEDLAVLGVNNRSLIQAKLPVPLSSVDSDLYHVGWEGAALLDRIMNGAAAPSEPILVTPKKVVARTSTATFVCDRPDVSVVVNYLRTHFHKAIRTEDVTRLGGISPRCLQMKFKEVLGRTISEELVRLRIEHAARLLRETDLKLDSIALESGLRTAKYLCDVFRRDLGTSPAAYREAKRAVQVGR